MWLFLQLILLQLTSYGWIAWAVFVVVTILAAVARRVGVLVGAQILIAVIVTVLDVIWVQEEMRRPGWDGQPDQDLIFLLGVLVRVVMINSLLLPVAYIAMRWRGKSTTQV
jgi:hypothetical protein